MREPQYNILADIQDAIERAKLGKLALYWQRAIQREYCCKKVTPAEQQAYEQLQSILSEVPQWSDEEELFEDKKSAMYGRMTKRLDLQPFSIATQKQILRHYHPAYTPADLLCLYMLTGGVAKYIETLMDEGAFKKRTEAYLLYQ
jgi:hypothetical protein